MLKKIKYVAGSRRPDEGPEFHTVIGVLDRPSVRGLPGPSPQSRAEAAVQEPVGRAAPVAQPVCAEVEDRGF